MSVLDCAAAREAAPEFVLGILDGDARADVVIHLEGCPACRAVMGELSQAADALVLLAPEAEPPPGFQPAVLGRVAGRRRRWRTARLVAAVAAAAAIVSIVTVRVIDGARDAPTIAASAQPVLGVDGQRVGEVTVADADDGGDEVTIDVRVDYALEDGAYRVVLASRDARDELGTITVVDGRGTWSGHAPAPDGAASLALVDPAGQVRCSAVLVPG